MEIHIEQTTDYPYDLLLLADPNRELVDRYLKASDCFVALCEGQAVGVIVVQKQSINGAEVLSLSTGEVLHAVCFALSLMNGRDRIESLC